MIGQMMLLNRLLEATKDHNADLYAPAAGVAGVSGGFGIAAGKAHNKMKLMQRRAGTRPWNDLGKKLFDEYGINKALDSASIEYGLGGWKGMASEAKRVRNIRAAGALGTAAVGGGYLLNKHLKNKGRKNG